MLQVAGNEEAIQVIQLVASGVDIRQAQYHVQLKLLQDTAPLLASFIMKLPFNVAVPSDVCCLISDLLNLALTPFKQPSPSLPPPTAETGLSFFPIYQRFVEPTAIQLTSNYHVIRAWKMKMLAESTRHVTQL